MFLISRIFITIELCLHLYRLSDCKMVTEKNNVHLLVHAFECALSGIFILQNNIHINFGLSGHDPSKLRSSDFICSSFLVSYFLSSSYHIITWAGSEIGVFIIVIKSHIQFAKIICMNIASFRAWSLFERGDITIHRNIYL